MSFVVALLGSAYANTRHTRQRWSWRVLDLCPPRYADYDCSGNALLRRRRTFDGMMSFSAVGPSRVLLGAEQRAHGRRRIAPTRCHGRPAHAADDTLTPCRWPIVDPLMLHPHERPVHRAGWSRGVAGWHNALYRRCRHGRRRGVGWRRWKKKLKLSRFSSPRRLRRVNALRRITVREQLVYIRTIYILYVCTYTRIIW